MTAPENPEQKRDHHHPRAGDESGFRRGGELQTGGLERVALEHKKSEGGAREQFFFLEIALLPPEDKIGLCEACPDCDA
jgi:hypothetical protein